LAYCLFITKIREEHTSVIPKFRRPRKKNHKLKFRLVYTERTFAGLVEWEEEEEEQKETPVFFNVYICKISELKILFMLQKQNTKKLMCMVEISILGFTCF
jgi:hypothetical protein